MPEGTVRWFDPKKGYGFIQPKDGGADVFVHISALHRSNLEGLNEGDQVGYELETDPRTNKQKAADLVMIG